VDDEFPVGNAFLVEDLGDGPHERVAGCEGTIISEGVWFPVFPVVPR
jgi:hypothetical protein